MERRTLRNGSETNYQYARPYTIFEGLDVAFRKVVPDSVGTSGNHVEEASWDK